MQEPIDPKDFIGDSQGNSSQAENPWTSGLQTLSPRYLKSSGPKVRGPEIQRTLGPFQPNWYGTGKMYF